MQDIEIQILESMLPFSVNCGFFIPLFRTLPPGLIMEFGVGAGNSIKAISALTHRTIYGFDSFQGLPEPWREGDGIGAFKCDPPNLGPKVKLVIGMFADTLPSFMFDHNEPVAFAHIDCDLYNSAKTVLDNFKGRLQVSSILAFDEILGVHGCFANEFRAFTEFLTDTGVQVECLGRQGPEAATFKVTAC